MNIAKGTKCMILVLTTSLLLTSCSKDGENPESEQQTEQTKTIEWEVFHEFEPGETVTKFEISDDAKWLFYTNAMGTAYRIDKTTGEKSLLYANPLQFENGILYLHVVRDNDSYFAVSDDFGATQMEYHIGTYTNYAAGWFDGAFMNLIVNRMFVMPNGDLILPHIMEKANNAAYLQDNFLIAVSSDGGATWNRKESKPSSYIIAKQGNRLFAISEGWTGVETFASKLYYSDNAGTSWQESNLKYAPQAVDRENNLIAAGGNQILKLKGNSWTVYTWEGQTSFNDGLVFLDGLKYRGTTGNDPNGRKIDDIEFDANNHMYVIGRNKTTICRTKLN
ncbi:sialidase family protein [Confluentibacter sediminis]|uniref:sialidase family protein n=1 Tax=Confluentibacter sediminis TaxID=2219045 RepID=UPI000DADA3A9|nr:sialidase family protein [Confluentibacter sediminis]